LIIEVLDKVTGCKPRSTCRSSGGSQLILKAHGNSSEKSAYKNCNIVGQCYTQENTGLTVGMKYFIDILEKVSEFFVSCLGGMGDGL
jgi:hypothetical protein